MKKSLHFLCGKQASHRQPAILWRQTLERRGLYGHKRSRKQFKKEKEKKAERKFLSEEIPKVYQRVYSRVDRGGRAIKVPWALRLLLEAIQKLLSTEKNWQAQLASNKTKRSELSF
jgi:hypothetical protein